MVVVIAGMTALVLHSKSKYLPFGTLPFPTEVIETLDVLVVTAMKISVSVLHGSKSASNSLYWPPALGPALPYLNNKYLTETKEITNTIAYFLQIWQSLNHSKTWCNFMVEEWKTNLMSLAILFQLLCAQHVSDINISIIRSLRLCCWITTSVVLFSVRCVLEIWCGWFWVVLVLQAEDSDF